MLCKKAGVPRQDVRGQITSHRARATIATQLYNAKDPMTLFELQAWLGHTPRIDPALRADHPVTLTKAYTDAGYFARNVRTIEVLLDRDAITNGRPETAGPLSSMTSGTATAPTASLSNARTGWRAPAATSTCRSIPVRPAARGQGRPAPDAVQIPLTDSERAAVDGDQTPSTGCLPLIDTPTPSGQRRNTSPAEPDNGQGSIVRSKPTPLALANTNGGPAVGAVCRFARSVESQALERRGDTGFSRGQLGQDSLRRSTREAYQQISNRRVRSAVLQRSSNRAATPRSPRRRGARRTRETAVDGPASAPRARRHRVRERWLRGELAGVGPTIC